MTHHAETGDGCPVTRTETFWPYFFGGEPHLKDRVEGAMGGWSSRKLRWLDAARATSAMASRE